MPDLDSMKRYILVKPLETEYGTLHENAEITLFRGFVYIDNNMLVPGWGKFIMELLEKDKDKHEYFKEIGIIHNKV